MSTVKKLLILSCSTGMGHIRAGEALRLSCKQHYPSVEVVHIDIAKYLNFFVYLYVISGYNFFSKIFPSVYKIIFYLTDNIFTQKFFRLFGPLLSLGAQKLFSYIDEYKPDQILSTHFIPALILPKRFSIPISMVITDYHAHAVWLSKRINHFFVATPEIQKFLAEHQISSVVSGIPISPEFLIQKNSTELKRQLGLHNDWPTILIMPIFTDHIRTEEIINALHLQKPQTNIIVATGKNESLFKKLNGQKKEQVVILPKSAQVSDWMRIADVVISKAGGLTISEAIYLQKPIIVINPIPGQEDFNSAYIVKQRYGLRAHSIVELLAATKAILTNPNLIYKKSHPNAGKMILETIISNPPN